MVNEEWKDETCSIPSCDRPVAEAQPGSGLCSTHLKRRGTPRANAPIREYRKPGKVPLFVRLLLDASLITTVKRAARARGLSVNAYLTELVEQQLAHTQQ